MRWIRATWWTVAGVVVLLTGIGWGQVPETPPAPSLLPDPPGSEAAAGSATQSVAALSGAERRKIRDLEMGYRRARRSVEDKAEVVAEAMRLGPLAVEAVHKLIVGELEPQLARYRVRFLREAEQAAKQKLGRVEPAEVVVLQQQVLALKEDPNLTKEQIVRVADPAMIRLELLLLVPREAVLGRSRPLVDARRALAPLGTLWETCEAYLAKSQQMAVPDGESTPVVPLRFEEYVARDEELAIRLTIPMPDAAKQVLARNATFDSKLTPEESRCVLSLNMTRIALGLAPVAVDMALTATARDHSHDMQELKFFAHESPVEGKTTPWDRAKRFGTSASGENIAMGVRSGVQANLMWFHSPGHHRNMLGDHKRVGIGVEGVHWTELFGN